MRTLGLLAIAGVIFAAVGCDKNNGNIAGVPQGCGNMPAQYCMPYGGMGMMGGGYGGYGSYYSPYGYGGYGGCNTGWTPMAFGPSYNCLNPTLFNYGNPYMSGGYGSTCVVGSPCPFPGTVCLPLGYGNIGYCR